MATIGVLSPLLPQMRKALKKRKKLSSKSNFPLLKSGISTILNYGQSFGGELAVAPNFVVIVGTNTRIYFGKHPTCQSVIVHRFISKLTIPLPIYVFFKRPLVQEHFAEILLHFDRLRISRVIGCLKWNNLKPFVLDRFYSALEKTSANHNI